MIARHRASKHRQRCGETWLRILGGAAGKWTVRVITELSVVDDEAVSAPAASGLVLIGFVARGLIAAIRRRSMRRHRQRHSHVVPFRQCATGSASHGITRPCGRISGARARL